MKQIELAKALNTHSSVLSVIESGKGNPTSEMIVDLSKFFNVSADYLLTGKEGADTIDEKEQEVIKLYREDSGLRESLNMMIDVKKKMNEYAKNYRMRHLQGA